MEKNTDNLMEVLKSVKPGETDEYFNDNSDELFSEVKAFAKYIKELIKEHGKKQQEVIDRAGFSEKYGYRLLAEDKHTKQRDYIIRICLAGEFTLDETQRVLKLYGMNALYPRIERDAVLISYINNCAFNIEDINRNLENKGMSILKNSEEE